MCTYLLVFVRMMGGIWLPCHFYLTYSHAHDTCTWYIAVWWWYIAVWPYTAISHGIVTTTLGELEPYKISVYTNSYVSTHRTSHKCGGHWVHMKVHSPSLCRHRTGTNENLHTYVHTYRAILIHIREDWRSEPPYLTVLVRCAGVYSSHNCVVQVYSWESHSHISC